MFKEPLIKAMVTMALVMETIMDPKQSLAMVAVSVLGLLIMDINKMDLTHKADTVERLKNETPHK